MKILHLPHGYHPATGGAERLAEGWSEALADRGHTVRVSVADLETPEGLYCFGVGSTGRSEESHSGVEIHRLSVDPSYRVGGLLFRKDPYAAGRVADRIRRRVRTRLERQLRHEIERFAPDVVLTLPHLFENVRAVFDLRRELQFPLVWAPLLHETDPYWPYEEVRAAVAHTDALVAMTPSEAARLVDAYGAHPDRVHVVPPGVALAEKPPGKAASPPTVLYLGRLSHTKGFDLLGEAMSIVWRQSPETRLVVAGASTPDSEALQDDLVLRAKRANGSTQIRLNVSENEKHQMLRDATVLVLPSSRESFGIVILEAWAEATPVVAVASPATSDTVADGVDGILVPDGDAERLAGALLGRLSDADGSHAMGRAGHERVRSDYTWESAAARLEAVYERVVSGRSENSS